MSEFIRIKLVLRQNGAACSAVDDVHLRASLDEADGRVVEHADVLCFTRAVHAGDVAAQLTAHPGCAVCVGRDESGTLLIAVRGGGRCVSGPLIASAVHAMLTGATVEDQPSSPASVAGACSRSGASAPARRRPARRAATGSLPANSSDACS